MREAVQSERLIGLGKERRMSVTNMGDVPVPISQEHKSPVKVFGPALGRDQPVRAVRGCC
jgi:hypothetical protein